MAWRQLEAKRPVLGAGIIWGGCVGVALLVLSLLSYLLGSITGPVISWLTIIVVAAGYAWAGLRASRHTDRMSNGTIAGLIAGFVAYVINLLGNLIALPLYINQALSHPHPSSLTASVISSNVILTCLYELVLYGILAGVILGLIGGNIGLYRSVRPSERPSERE